MIDFRTLFDARFLHFNEIADTGAFADLGAGTKPRIGADDRAGAHLRPLKMAKGANLDAFGDRYAGAEHGIGADRHIRAEYRIEAEPGGRRIQERRPVFHRCLAETRLQHRFRLGELGTVVDAHDFFRRCHSMDAIEAASAGASDDIGEVIFALGVVVADVVEKGKEMPAVDRDDAGIAQCNLGVDGIGVEALDDALKPAVRPKNEAAVCGVVVGLESEYRERRAGAPGSQQGVERLRRDQRHIAIKHQHIPAESVERLFRHQNRVAAAEALLLDGDFGLRRAVRQGLADALHVRPEDQHQALRCEAARGGEHMMQHRPPGNRVQHFRPARLHARALPGCQNDDGGLSHVSGGCHMLELIRWRMIRRFAPVCQPALAHYLVMGRN